MPQPIRAPRTQQFSTLWPATLGCGFLFLCLTGGPIRAAENLLQNPGFEQPTLSAESVPHWIARSEDAPAVAKLSSETHEGRQCLNLPAHTAVEQRVDPAPAGAYVARCWIKSPSDQTITLLLQDLARPWAVYTCAELQVRSNQWEQVQAFCVLDQPGSLTFTIGSTSKDFRFYHGAGSDLSAPVLADDCQLNRYEPETPPTLAIWDAANQPGPALDWSARNQWSLIKTPSHTFAGTPVLQGRELACGFSLSDGALRMYSVQKEHAQPRAIIVPASPFPVAHCELVQTNGQTGIHAASVDGQKSYTAWMSPEGVVRIEASHIPSFSVRDARLRYGLLPSFVGADICYAPRKFPGLKQLSIPSTQWFVGLVDGHDSMLVAVWDNDSQAATLGFSGEGKDRLIDSFSIGTANAGFALSFVEHPSLWHEEALQEDWLGEYVPIAWQRPFPAHWIGHMFVSPGGKPSFRQPFMDYSFPFADAKTRLWGVWFEDWNHHPFFFDGGRTMLHFEKTFIPSGDALIYFLEPAAADLFSPSQIVEQVLGPQKAAELFDFDGNALRRLKYSTPNEFMYDRPVCATTTRLSKIKNSEKDTVGVNLVTHLYEFIREIRSRVDQYAAFFQELDAYFAGEKKAHPETQRYIEELETVVGDAPSKTREIYATPLPAVKEKTESMKKLLAEGKGDGFDCGKLDVRGPAGAQDDLCRRYNRLVLRLSQTAAWQAGDSPAQAAIAKHIWDESRKILRQPTRWEPRRTLSFFEP